MEEIGINLAERSYSILIGRELLVETGAIFKERGISGRILVITNPTVAGWHLEPVLTSLHEAGFDVQSLEIPDGESYKSLEQANVIYDALIEGTFDRTSILVALGGGVIGDLTGFAAATYMRGIRFIQLPTTLLAQVDSSIGGKVAVNHPKGKNLIGAFYQPSLVIADVSTLKTLPKREFSSGMAEVIKHGVILDENYLRLITGEAAAIRQYDPALLSWIVSGSCRIKGRVVEEDEQESGLRMVLNLGHTIGHAIESATNYSFYKHGEAVALGMLGAVRISARMDLLRQADLSERLLEIYHQFNLPVDLPGLNVNKILEAISLDKKARFNKVRWVLPVRTGETVISDQVPAEITAEVLRQMGGLA
ncbi:MAG: 3-dehydroquinate synthase [Bacillota bacterium]